MYDRNSRWALLALLTAAVAVPGVTYALPVAIANTGFEVAQGYPAPPAYYDVRTITPAPDAGLNWSAGWVGSKGGSTYSFIESDSTAYAGDQHLQLTRPSNTSTNDMFIGRQFDGALTQGNRLTFQCAIRMNTSADALAANGKYFSGNGQLFIEHATANSTGDENIRLEFSRDPSNGGFAPLTLKGAGELTGSGTKRFDVTLGNWDDPNGGMYAKDTWLLIKLDMNTAAQTVDVYMNGTFIDNYPFQNLLGAGVNIDKVRFRAPRGYGDTLPDGVTLLWPGTGCSVDEVSFITDPDAPMHGCAVAVSPSDQQQVTADLGGVPDPSSIPFTVGNSGTEAFDYTVDILDEALQPYAPSWLQLDNTDGALASLETDAVTASLNTTGLSGGVYTAVLRFNNDCGADPVLRTITMTVIGCHWTVDSCSQLRSYLEAYPSVPIPDVVYRITNTGSEPMGYSVAQTSGEDWLAVLNPTGTVPVGSYVDVIAQISKAQLEARSGCDDWDCSPTCALTFTDDCSAQVVTRNVKVRVSPSSDTHVFAYNGDVPPLQDDSAGTGYRFGLYEGDDNGAVETDPAADDGKVWHIVDTDTTKTKYRSERYDAGATSHPWYKYKFRPEVGVTIVSRLRVYGQSGSRSGGLFFWGENGEPGSRNPLLSTLYWGGADGLLEETERGIGTSLTPSDQFVIVRMTAIGRETEEWDCSRIIRLYFNENPTPAVDMVAAATRSTSTSDDYGLGFGAGSTSGTYDIAFDWVSGTNTGAFAPGEEVAVIGQSLVPVRCPGDWADLDGDSDVDVEDFGLWQLCFTGADDPYGNFDRVSCGCLDRDFDDDVDADDGGAFAACSTGAGVAFDAENPPPGCIP